MLHCLHHFSRLLAELSNLEDLTEKAEKDIEKRIGDMDKIMKNIGRVDQDRKDLEVTYQNFRNLKMKIPNSSDFPGSSAAAYTGQTAPATSAPIASAIVQGLPSNISECRAH